MSKHADEGRGGPRRAGRLLAGGGLIVLLAAAGPARAQASEEAADSRVPPPAAAQLPQVPDSLPAGPTQTGDVTLMVLEASVNGAPTHQLLTLKQTVDGAFIGRADELRKIRIQLGPAFGYAEDVPLAALGIEADYDEARQAIALTVPVERLDTFVVSLGGDRRPTDLDHIDPLPGFLLNYGLYASHASDLTLVSGNVEALAMTSVGAFSATGLFNSERRYGGGNAVRLDTSWRLIDPRAIRSYTIGDFTSNAVSWSGSVRLAGLQIASAFDQRPDIVTTALPQFSGSAALPSTLDLFVNQQRVYSGEIPSGPFDLRALPYMSGGDVRLVTTDATGRQVEISKSYYYVARQLRKGVLQYSLDVGAPRLDYGLESFSYDDTVFASGSARYGVDGTLTLEARAEASADGLVNAGLGVVKSIGGIGAISGSFAGSSYDGRRGAKYAVEAEAQIAGLRMFAGTERTIDDYFDLVRVSALRNARRRGDDDDYGRWLGATARATRLDRAGVSFTPWFDPASISLSYNRIKSARDDRRTGSLTITRRITDRVSVYANGFMDLDDSDQFGVFATLSIRVGRAANASLGIQHDPGRTAYVAQATRSAGLRQGELGWGVANREYDSGDAHRTAYMSYRASEALVRAQVDESGGRWRGSAQVEGSIVAAGGGVFLANRIGDAFAIVQNAGPKVEVMQGGVRMGKTDASGRALLPGLIPYYEQRIQIDPTGLPDGWEAAATEQVAAAGYRQGTLVDFGAQRIHAAVLVLHRPDGSPIPAGYTVRLENDEPVVIGYDGQAYVRGLAPSNRITVDLGPDGVCSAQFSYDLNGPPQPQIGPLICQ